MTAELFSDPAEQMTEGEAREFVAYVREQQDEMPRRVIDGYQRRAWTALGYESWAAMCDGEDLRLPREVTSELRAGGLSLRAISSVTGASEPTVRRDLASSGASSSRGNDAPDERRVTGIDGKVYAPRTTVPPEPGPYEEPALPHDPAPAPPRSHPREPGIWDASPPPEPEPRPAVPKPAPVMLTLRTHKGDPVPYPKPQAKATFNQTDGEGISWAAWSWNPVTGCLHGCDYCYARAIAARFTSAYPAGFTPLFHEQRLDAPANTTIPAAHADDEAWKRVFVCSMADLYGRWVPDDWISQVHASMLASPEWQYILLTKFPARYVGLDMPPGAWIGTSVDEQKRVRIAEDAFRKIDGGAVKWLSLEPLKEPLEFTDLSVFDWVVIGAQTETRQPDGTVPAYMPDWEWICRITAQAKEAGCSVHWKPNLFNGRPGLPLNEYPAPKGRI
ncbi:hypothetical protein GCM10010182_67350 [Actinomadura cremea]|nr:hypothetical protein GCM10010182_67350 [Actinomadura cremea]